MIQLDSKLVLRAALPVLLVSLSACASVANYVLTGRLEDPDAQEAQNAQEAQDAKPLPVDDTSTSAPAKAAAPTAENKAHPSKPAAEPAMPEFPIDTTFAYGPWLLHRNSRGLFGWTGKGATFRLFAIELHALRPCWTSQKADRPRAQQCANGEVVLDSPVVANLFGGIDNPPWKSTTAGASLAEGTYDLPDSSGGKKGTFSLENTATTIKIKTPVSHGEFLFTLPKDNTSLFVDGEEAELYDGCTNSDGTLAVYSEMGVQIGKKKCGNSRSIDGLEATLKIDRLVLEFRIRESAPDITKARADADKLRKLAAENKAQIDISVVGDATYTLISARGKTPKGESFGFVESNRTIDGQHFRCQTKLEGADVAMLANAKQICSTMKLLK